MSNQTNPTVRTPTNCPPCPDALRWSTAAPTVPGFYFMRHQDASRSRWVTAVVEVKPPQPGMLLCVYGAYPFNGLILDQVPPGTQWSDRPVTEPTGG